MSNKLATQAESLVLENSKTVFRTHLARRIARDMRKNSDDVDVICKYILDGLLRCLEIHKEIHLREIGRFSLVMRTSQARPKKIIVLDDERVCTRSILPTIALEWSPTPTIKHLRKGLYQWQKLDEGKGTLFMEPIAVEIWTYPPKGIEGKALYLRTVSYNTGARTRVRRKQASISRT